MRLNGKPLGKRRSLCGTLDIYAVAGIVLLVTIFAYFLLFRFIIAELLARETFTAAYGGVAVVIAAILLLRLGLRLSFIPIYMYSFYLAIRFAAMGSWQDLSLISFFQYFEPIAFFFIGYYLWLLGRHEMIINSFILFTALSLLIGQANFYFGFGGTLFQGFSFELTMSGDEILRRAYSLAGYSLGTGYLATIATALALLRPRWQKLVLMGIFLPSLLNSYSRGAAIMLLVALCIWHLLPAHKSKLVQPFRILVIASIASLIIVMVLQFVPRLAHTYFNRFVLGLSLDEEGNYMRLISWRYAIDVWQRSPFFGVGFGILGSTPVIRTGSGLAPESMYLKVLGELGAVGLVLYVLATLLPPVRAWVRVVRPGIGLRQRRTAGAIVAIVIAMLLGGVYLQNLESDFLAALFWFLVGCLAAFADASIHEKGYIDQRASGV